MATTDYDVITVGGGLGGASVAKVIAEAGLRVLVTERERTFKDRIRGEFLAPWGVAEAQKLGLYELFMEKCGHEQPFIIFGGIFRDYRATTPQQLPALTFFHAAMQEIVLNAAQRAGAEVRRGVSVKHVRPGQPPSVSIESKGVTRDFTARIVVCADGRSSMGRTWGGFEVHRGKQRMLGAGVMFEGLSIAEDTAFATLSPGVQRTALIFPQGGGRARTYIAYGPHELDRLQGMDDAERFIDECVRSGMPPEFFKGGIPRGPLASFDMTETWVVHPYRDGLALIGDAAGSTDPTWGQGLSLTMRDARVLAECLNGANDFDEAGHAYANAHDAYLNACVTVEDWLFEMFFALGPEADAKRARALPKIAANPTRIPDHGASGPDLPYDESVRRRFFGED
jgi:2-polyprenyl-6-methoxyphenol hydroxylase-like FAD-dependent oxidoreductase